MSSSVEIAAYRSADQIVVSPVQMLVRGFNGLAEYLARAEKAFANGDGVGRAAALDRAFRIVEYLLAALDRTSDASAVPNLVDLYYFLLDRLARANIFNDPQLLAECRPVVENLRLAWKGVAESE